jgi:hypothetical protein
VLPQTGHFVTGSMRLLSSTGLHANNARLLRGAMTALHFWHRSQYSSNFFAPRGFIRVYFTETYQKPQHFVSRSVWNRSLSE